MFTNRRAVLHVDDDPLITRLVAEHLGRSGYESEAVHDPLCAMQALVRGQYRIAILDVHMPQKSGLQVLQEIKQFDAGIQVILLTAMVSETTVIEANRLGAEACLFKPLSDPGQLIDAVDDSFRRCDRWWDTLRDLTQRRKAAEQAVLSGK